MHAPRTRARTLPLAALVLGAALPASAQSRIVEIGPGALPTGQNARGEVVGTIEVGERTHCFFWDGTLHDLGTAGDGACRAAGVNDRRQMVGTRSGLTDESWQAFTCDLPSGLCQDLPSPLGRGPSLGLGINAGGTIVGAAWDGAGRARPFVFDGAVSRLLTADTEGIARAVNDAGVVVGAADTGVPGESRPFRWEAGVLTRLGSFGGRTGEAWAIGAGGAITGISSRDDGRPVAFRQAEGRDGLDALVDAPASYGRSVNGVGWVVGEFETPQGRHAFLAGPDGAVDLNDLLPRGTGWVLESAAAINDRGQIAGQGWHDGRPAGFLMSLPPSP